MTRSNVNSKTNSDGGITSFSVTHVGKNVSYVIKENKKKSNNIIEEPGNALHCGIVTMTLFI
jgi:hypothetical protein